MPTISDSKCILVIGATAGIGRALALSLNSLPSKPTVIVGGRRQERLDELSRESRTGLETVRVDVNSDKETLKQFVNGVINKHPDLDAVVFSAGIQHEFDFSRPEGIDLEKVMDELNTNYISIVTLITLFLPHFIKLGSQGRPCFIIPITSGLAIIPAAWVPNYAATKAALHSFSLSLSVRLKDKNVHVMEILPPLVESELHDHQGMSGILSKFWMPLDDFTKLAVEGLQRGDVEIPIGQASQSHQRFEAGKLDVVGKTFMERDSWLRG